MIIQLIQRFVARLEVLKGSNTVIHLEHALAALSGDIIRQICCNNGEYFLDDPEFVPWWYATSYQCSHYISTHQALGLTCFTK